MTVPKMPKIRWPLSSGLVNKMIDPAVKTALATTPKMSVDLLEFRKLISFNCVISAVANQRLSIWMESLFMEVTSPLTDCSKIVAFILSPFWTKYLVSKFSL